MGLLDDAIREHLESKRQHGADPSEVARQEQEALGPVDRGGGITPAEHTDPANTPEGAARLETESVSATTGARPGAGPDSAHGGQETAELDMRTVLKTEASGTAMGSAEDSLEWEVPGDSLPESDGASAGGGESAGVADAAEESVEDVLEETPDFLRDTPDQERLWFEQQPPRDFDFDK
jgi:hypothetical protein